MEASQQGQCLMKNVSLPRAERLESRAYSSDRSQIGHGGSFGKLKTKLLGKPYHLEITVSSYKEFVNCSVCR